MTTVQLQMLTKHFQTVAAVKALDLTVATGELVALLGPSGCGKTTTMRMIAGLLAPDSGNILFDGRSVLAIPPERRGAVMVFQKHLLFPHLNVAENVGFGLKMRGLPPARISQRVSTMLELVQLSGYERRRAHELSGGQQQRVALARALVIEPQVLLLDEPLANLDTSLRLEMRQLIRTIQQSLGITTIFVTHDQEEAVMIANRVALMIQGVLHQYDEPRAFYERPQSATVARFFRNENFLPGLKQGNQIETAFGRLTCSTPQPVADGPVWVTVRPEQVELAATNPVNLIPATVAAVTYMGGYVQLRVQIGLHPWLVNTPAQTTVQVGQALTLHLPPAQLWLVPAA
ncbi:MAG: ABC transporter ATP-binding protein [Caldilineaceae bacterium]|nr:ABC transporter ATP-binding protein [Caldilineaceae bacterium]